MFSKMLIEKTIYIMVELYKTLSVTQPGGGKWAIAHFILSFAQWNFIY